jgi:hypothetical protein
MWLTNFCGRLSLKSNTVEIDGILFSLDWNLIEAPFGLIPYLMHIFLAILLSFCLSGAGDGMRNLVTS